MSLLVPPRRALADTVVVAQPVPSAAVEPYVLAIPANEPSRSQILAALRQKVKYVFVLFQENRSFDSYFGTFPGADGLFSQPPSQTPGYSQPIENVDGTMGIVQPFRVGPAQFAADLDDVDHSFARMGAKMHLVDGVPRMDRFALLEEQKYIKPGERPTLKAKQYGELAMAYEDCDTIPFLWSYASRFVLFDRFFQHTIGPSTPNAIAMIAGQTGETQWVKHPEQASNVPELRARGAGEPLVTDADPLFGAKSETTQSGMPVNPRDRDTAALNQTYASLPLTLLGRAATQATGRDRDAAHDLLDVQADIPAIQSHGAKQMPWGWYEEGFDREPSDAADAGAHGSHASYIGHHNGPQYFGYVANNPEMTVNLHGLGDWFDDMKGEKLSPEGGVYYVRGGFQNIAGLKPALDNPAVQKNFQGDDDHPGYSDSHLSEALVAREVNAIARSPYWAQSVIIITYDESEGDYDHVAPAINETDPEGLPLSRGPRIPAIVISPFARAHVVSHETGDHNAVIKLIDALFDLPPLADLPDELAARLEGEVHYHQANLGPADDLTPDVGDMLSAFDPRRLLGTAPPLPAAYATIGDDVVATVPPYGDQGCHAIGIEPTDVTLGIHNPIPADFNPRPSTVPTPP